MSAPCGGTSSRMRFTLAVVAGTVLAAVSSVVVPTLLATSASGTSAAVAGLALAVAALLVLAVGLLTLGASSVSVSVPAAEGPPPVLTGQATDPVHHPVRPRAPGPA